MFEKTLTKESKNHLATLGASGLLTSCYLAGGTACALQLGHRISVDFDFFTPQKFQPKQIAAKLLKYGSFKEDYFDSDTLRGIFVTTKFSLFYYDYPTLFKTQSYLSIALADIQDIAAMKIDAIASRGAKRDFVDLYFICKSGYRLKELLLCYDRKYKRLSSNLFHLKKSLVFFNDADEDDDPKMLRKISWDTIKTYFEYEVMRL